MFRVFLAAALFCGTLYAQGSPSPPKEPAPIPPQVDVAEVLRRGDLVVVAGEGPRGADEDAMRMATAPPPDESSMWFVTVIKTNNCEHCTKLHSDFLAAPELLAFVAATPPYKPWGHYNEYNVNDETQKWRIKAYRIAGYPTIVIQPPRNGMWGNPKTVVYQSTGYNGNPKKLAADITAGVRKYAAKMSEQGYPKMQSPEVQEGARSATKQPSTQDRGSVDSPLWGNKESPIRLVGAISSQDGKTATATGIAAPYRDAMTGKSIPSRQISPQPYLILPATSPKSFPVVVGGAKQFTPEPSAPVPTEHLDHPAGRGQYTPAQGYPPAIGVNPPFAVPPRVDPFNPQPLSPNQPNVTPNQWPPTDQVPPSSPQVPGLGVVMSLLLQMFGSFLGGSGLTNLLLLIVAGIQVLSIVAPLTKTKLDDEALAVLKQIRTQLGGSSQTPPSPSGPPTPPTTTQV